MTTRMRVLLIEDDEVDQRIILRATRHFADCVVAEDLATARALLRRERFDAALVDIDLGLDDGLNVIPELPMPTVVLTHRKDESSLDDAVAAGAQEFMVKSEVNSGILHRVLKFAVERKKLQHSVDVKALSATLADRIAGPATTLHMNLEILRDSFATGEDSLAPILDDMETVLDFVNETVRDLQAYASGAGPRPTWSPQLPVTGEFEIPVDFAKGE